MASQGYEQFCTDMKDKHVLIFGLGVQGGGAHVAEMFAQAGAHVRVSDQKTETELSETVQSLKQYTIEYSLGGHKEEDIEWADIIVKNPSVPTQHPHIQKAFALNKRVTTEVALYLLYTCAQTIGVTGTRGKTTTTNMIYQIMRSCKPSVLMGGNIKGLSALELLKQEEKDSWVVLELSSWQLEGCHWEKVSPHVAVITNLYEDHLNRYDSMDAYAYDKAAICMYQKEHDVVLLNANNTYTSFFEKKATGEVKYFDGMKLNQDIQLSIPGEHNKDNAAACMEVLEFIGCSKEHIIAGLKAFKGVSSRFETIRVVRGVQYINDTTSTTPMALHVALNTARQLVDTRHGRIILLCGGSSKKLSLQPLIDDVNLLADKVILLPGTGTDEIRKDIRPEKILTSVSSMKDAVISASVEAKDGDIVLLSPGFASFGLFINEFDRGDQFNALVQTL